LWNAYTKNEDFGTNTDGSKSKEYCHFCYKDGKFLDEGITMEQKIGKTFLNIKKTIHSQ